MVLNAEELESELDFTFILDHINNDPAGVRAKGINAVALSGAPTVGSFALRMGKDMHSAEIVYMSGYYFYRILDQLSQKLKPLVEAGKQGTRHFLSDEKKKKQLEKEETEAKITAAFKDKLWASLTQFAEQKGLSDPKYLEILRRLTFMVSSYSQFKRTKIIDLLKSGDVDGA